MNREQFFAKLAPLGEDDLRKALWNLYWRGSAAVRQRIEAELEPPEVKRRPRTPPPPPDASLVRFQVEDFVALARAGAYIGGDRRVSPKERTRWRFAFRQLTADARDALRANDDKDFATAARAMATLLDFACELRGREYFRSEDPIEAAKIVISDEVAVLWGRVRDHSGLPGFAEQAAPQLIRWESEYGWTRGGWGGTREKEISLARVVERMLPVPDAWDLFADRYLAALDEVSGPPSRSGRSSRRQPWEPVDSADWRRKERTKSLAEWHGLLLDRLANGDESGASRLDRLVNHPALGGPERTFLQARRAHQCGQTERARRLIEECLSKLPGHNDFLDFAQEIGAPLPPRAREILDERARFVAKAATS
jgi:hypothetical protein